MKSTILVGLQHGDEGKGKVAYHWMKNNGPYTYAIRFNGGPNAGHCVYISPEKRVILHQIPTGILLPDVICVIGVGCVIDLAKLKQEIHQLEEAGIPNVKNRLFLSNTAHIITQKHIEEDRFHNKVGTTASGIGPSYADKAYRTGLRVEDLSLIDLPCDRINLDELLGKCSKDTRIFWEGAQGFELDIDWGDYPFVTSSHCISASACLNGAEMRTIESIIGVGKVYDTYLGAKQLQDPFDESLKRIQEIGREYGNTTGRTRQVGYLHLQRLVRALKVNQCDTLILNKGDILQEVNIYRFYDTAGNIQQANSWENFKDLVMSFLPNVEIIWSCSPYCI